MREGTHQHRDLVEGDAIAVHIEHHLGISYFFQARIDALDEGALRLALGIFTHDQPDFFDSLDAARARFSRRVQPVGCGELPPGPPGLAQRDPGNAQPPLVATVNYAAGQTRGNNAIVMLASSGTGTLAVKNYTPLGAVHFIVDVNGYFQ